MLWVADRNGDAFFVCPDWEQVTGQPREQALGRGWMEKVHPDDRGDVIAQLADALSRCIPFAVAYRLQRRNGDYGLCIAGAIPAVGPPANSFLGFFGSVAEVGAKAGRAAAGLTETPPPSFTRVTTLELIADHLLVAHALSGDAAGQTARSHIEEALTNIRREMIAVANETDKRLN